MMSARASTDSLSLSAGASTRYSSQKMSSGTPSWSISGSQISRQVSAHTPMNSPCMATALPGKRDAEVRQIAREADQAISCGRLPTLPIAQRARRTPVGLPSGAQGSEQGRSVSRIPAADRIDSRIDSAERESKHAQDIQTAGRGYVR